MNLLDHVRARAYDLLHNVETHTRVPLAQLHVVGRNKPLGHMYFPTLPKSMAALLGNFPNLTGRDRTFIDIGSGKGVTLLVAARYPFKKVIGVEFSEELHRIAQRNITGYRGSLRCKDVETLCIDATQFDFPAGPLLIYFFNPFHESIMEQVLARLAASLRDDPRDVTVMCDVLHDRRLIMRYLQPQKIDVFLGYSAYSRLIPVAPELAKMPSNAEPVSAEESRKTG